MICKQPAWLAEILSLKILLSPRKRLFQQTTFKPHHQAIRVPYRLRELTFAHCVLALLGKAQLLYTIAPCQTFMRLLTKSFLHHVFKNPTRGNFFWDGWQGSRDACKYPWTNTSLASTSCFVFPMALPTTIHSSASGQKGHDGSLAQVDPVWTKLPCL